MMIVMWVGGNSYVVRETSLLEHQMKLPTANAGEIAPTKSRLAAMTALRTKAQRNLILTASGWILIEVIAAVLKKRKSAILR